MGEFIEHLYWMNVFPLTFPLLMIRPSTEIMSNLYTLLNWLKSKIL